MRSRVTGGLSVVVGHIWPMGVLVVLLSLCYALRGPYPASKRQEKSSKHDYWKNYLLKPLGIHRFKEVDPPIGHTGTCEGP